MMLIINILSVVIYIILCFLIEYKKYTNVGEK